MSPLLDKSDSHRNTNLALNIDDVVEPIDDADTDQDENMPIPEKSRNYGMIQSQTLTHIQIQTRLVN